LEVRSETSGLRCACAKCAADLGAVRENYKGALRAPRSRHQRRQPQHRRLPPLHRRPAGVPPVLCPGCGALIENEIARADDPVLRDIELDLR